jgi:DNA mismatch repair protein MutS
MPRSLPTTKVFSLERDATDDSTVTKPQKEDAKLYSEYFKTTKEYRTIYGNNTLLLTQVGSFFEIYGLKNTITNETTEDSEIIAISNICQFNIAEKKATFNGHQILAAGFPDYKLEKYLQKITENSFTVVVYVQERNEKNTNRVFHSIHSPGTYLSYETDSSPQITNNIMCIWFETYKPIGLGSRESRTRENIVCGVSVANIFTGESFLFEYKTPFFMNPTTFDELERCISGFLPSEIIIISPFDTKTLSTVIQYSGIKSSILHKVDLSDEKAQKCCKQRYIQHMITTFYSEETYQICSEFQTNSVATQSFCYLLHFIQEHNSNLVRKIALPKFNNSSDRMVLANHTLKQLNIIDDGSGDGKKSGQLSSVVSFLNKCCTSMGSRRFRMQLLNPTFNEEWLNREYKTISCLLEEGNCESIMYFRKLLLQIKDIEKMCRQIIVKKIYPSSIYNLHNSIYLIQQLHSRLHSLNTDEFIHYLCSDFTDGTTDRMDYIDVHCHKINEFMNMFLIIEECKNIHSVQSFDNIIIQRGISAKLDELIDKQSENIELFHRIKEVLNNLMKIKCSNQSETHIDYVREHETEKSGSSLQITKKRGTVLKTILSEIACSQNPVLKITGVVSIPAKDFKITNSSASNDEIDCPLLTKITKEIVTAKDKINKEIGIVYGSFIEILEKEWFGVLENIANYVSKLDVLQCKAYIAKEYHYCRPTIVDSEKSFIDAKDLRHCLIEHIQQNELYVCNDLEIGKDVNGILLYGTNAVGKTSMIRALGISCVLAQAGMFVPCSQYHYKPYTSIFSRILGNDNIFKGLSTFAVEMSELRIILKLADKNSLILGDELCSGTETESAQSIFVAGLNELHEKDSSFIFATHFHEIINYEEVVAMKKLQMKHLSVYYDRELDCLVYDRKLKEGSGTKMYGLEVCKSLHLPEEFLDKAYALRSKYFPETRGELSYETTVYNSKKIRGKCEICKINIGEEIHHLQEQREADTNGFIGNIHKNHIANLVSVCQKCHDNIHSSQKTETTTVEKKKVVKKKTTKGYILT